MEHSDIIGGSTAAKRIHCPGSYQLEKSIPTNRKSSSFADRGTALHNAMEYWLLEGVESTELIGREFEVEGKAWVITHELYEDKIEPAVDAFYEIEKKAGGFADYLVEVQVSLDKYVPGAFGTVDVLAVGNDGKLYVIDWKFGDGILVSPVANFQAGFYGTGALYGKHYDRKQQAALNKLKKAAAFDDNGYCDVELVIVQPRPHMTEEPNWVSWSTTSEWLESFTVLLVNAWENMQRKNAPIKAGSHCRWCVALPVCPEYKQKARKVIASDADPKNLLLDGVTLSAWLNDFDFIETFIKAVREYAHDEMLRGVKVPGWKPVDKRGTRQWVDENEAYVALLDNGFGGEITLQPQKLKTPAQIQKVVGTDTYEDKIKKHVELVVSGTTIAPESDSRPSVADPAKQMKATLGKLKAGNNPFPSSKPKAKS